MRSIHGNQLEKLEKRRFTGRATYVSFGMVNECLRRCDSCFEVVGSWQVRGSWQLLVGAPLPGASSVYMVEALEVGWVVSNGGKTTSTRLYISITWHRVCGCRACHQANIICAVPRNPECWKLSPGAPLIVRANERARGEHTSETRRADGPLRKVWMETRRLAL